MTVKTLPYELTLTMISRKKLYVNFATAKYFPNFRLLLEKKVFKKKLIIDVVISNNKLKIKLVSISGFSPHEIITEIFQN